MVRAHPTVPAQTIADPTDDEAAAREPTLDLSQWLRFNRLWGEGYLMQPQHPSAGRAPV